MAPHTDLNRGPKDYESSALTTELQARLESFEQKGVYLGASNFFAEDFCPPGIAFSNAWRTCRAKQLLSDTNHPISMISELCGFNDPERMAVVFKRIEGIAPSVFRKGSMPQSSKRQRL